MSDGRSSSNISLSHPSKEWNKCYFKKAIKIISPNVDRLTECLQKELPVRTYQFKLSQISGAFKNVTVSFDFFQAKLFYFCHLKVFLQNHQNKNQEIEVHVSLFDTIYKQFFGNTCPGPGKATTVANGVAVCKYNESVFLSTAFDDNHILIVCELIVSKNGQKTSIGWSAFRPFDPKAVDPQRMTIYLGTPRALFFLEDPFESKTTGKQWGC